MLEKLCTHCKVPKATTEFWLTIRNPDGRHSWCKTCMSEFIKPHRKKTSSKESVKKRRHSLKDEVIAAYGNKCACCGVNIRQFLTLDHVNGREGMTRNQLRSGLHYRQAKREGYPSKFQVLCYNCNCSKGFYGACPHTTIQTTDGENLDECNT